MRAPFSFMGAGTPTLLKADLDVLTPGTMSAGAFLAATGMTFGRDAATSPLGLGPSIQTSASTLSFPGLTADVVHIGDNGSGVGVILQPRCRNFANVNLTRDINSSGWQTAVGSTYPYLGSVGPDGLFLANHLSGASANVSNYLNLASPSPGGRHFCASEWLKPTPGGTGDPVQCTTLRFNSGTPTLVSYGTATPPAAWQRVSLPLDSWDTAGFFPVDGTTEIGNGGVGPGARDMLFDCIQIDGNDFASEYLDGGNAATIRERDALAWPASSGFVDADGSLSFYIRFIAKHGTARTPYADASSLGAQAVQDCQYLFRFNDTNDGYARINVGIGTAWRLELQVSNSFSAVGQVSSGSIAWAVNDIVEVFIKVGGGVATIAKWRVGLTGAWTAFGLTSTFNTFSAGTSSLTIGGGSPSSSGEPHTSLWARVQKSYIYKSGRRPAGV